MNTRKFFIFLVFSWLFLLLVSCEPSSVTVCFDYNCNTMRNRTVVLKKNEFICSPEIPVRDGYYLDGWYTGGEKWDFSADTVKKDITLVATWTPFSYKALLDANGGTVETVEVLFDYDSTFSLPDPHRDGYFFLGWYLPDKYVNGISKWIWAENKTFIARWLPFEPGTTTALFGNYEQDGDLENGAEPIEWYIIEEKDNKYWLLSKYVLTGHRYDVSNSFVIWNDCELRNWLVNDFFFQIFSQDEQAHVCPSYQEDTLTSDKIFLLSKEESYITGKIGAMLNGEGIGTEYAVTTGLEYSYNDVLNFDRQAWWWLRSGIENQATAAAFCGSFTYSGSGRSMHGVRPSIWVEKSAVKLLFHNANGEG